MEGDEAASRKLGHEQGLVINDASGFRRVDLVTAYALQNHNHALTTPGESEILLKEENSASNK